jgi:hypothetical protein
MVIKSGADGEQALVQQDEMMDQRRSDQQYGCGHYERARQGSLEQAQRHRCAERSHCGEDQ